MTEKLNAISVSAAAEIPSKLFRWAAAEGADSLTVAQIKSLSSMVAVMMNETGMESYAIARERYKTEGR